MKKFNLLLILFSVFAFSLTSCDKKNSDDDYSVEIVGQYAGTLKNDLLGVNKPADIVVTRTDVNKANIKLTEGITLYYEEETTGLVVIDTTINIEHVSTVSLVGDKYKTNGTGNIAFPKKTFTIDVPGLGAMPMDLTLTLEAKYTGEFDKEGNVSLTCNFTVKTNIPPVAMEQMGGFPSNLKFEYTGTLK